MVAMIGLPIVAQESTSDYYTIATPETLQSFLRLDLNLLQTSFLGLVLGPA